MQYTVVHSTDPYLLARLATDLQMDGFGITSDIWSEYFHPFSHDNIWMPIYSSKVFDFHPHDCNDPSEIRHELTSRNYIDILTQILEP